MAYEISLTPASDDPSKTYSDTGEVGIDYRHTAIHTATVRIPESAADAAVYRLGDAVLSLNGDTLLNGRVSKVVPTQGPFTELEVEGPGWILKRQGPTNDQVPVTYSDDAAANVIRDYASLRGLDVTVYDPPTTVQADDEVLQSSFVEKFSLFQFGGTDPVVASGDDFIRPAKTAYVRVQSDFTGLYAIQQDTAGNPPFHISGEYAELTASTDNVAATVTPEYTIPSERVGVAVSVDLSGGGSGTAPVTLNGTRLADFVFAGSEPGGKWELFPSEYDDNGGSDLLSGQSYTLNVDLNSSDFDLDIDALAIYDTQYPPSVWDEPTSLNDPIAGPEPYPERVTLAAETAPTSWNITDIRFDATASDTSGPYQYAASINAGADTTIVSNQEDASIDFKSKEEYGAALDVTLTFGGWDDPNRVDPQGPTPTQRNAPQELSLYRVFVTTDTTPLIGSVELNDSDFANLQTLHGDTGLRFTIDPDEPTPVITSFAPDDPSVAGPKTWEPLTEPLPEFDVTGYANRATAVNPETGIQVTVRDRDSISEYGNIPAPPVYTSNQDLKLTAQREVIKRRAENQPQTEFEATPAPVVPGRPYQFDFGLTALDTVRYQVSPDSASMTLTFGEQRSLVDRLIETRQQTRQ